MIYAIGAFDGFHKGHQTLLVRAARLAAERGTGWGVITFDAHPRTILKGGFRLLFTYSERDIIAKALGIPCIEKMHFTREFAALTPHEFTDYLAERCKVDGFVVGENFRFGKDRAGDPKLLAELAHERGWSLDVIPSYMIDGCVVSCTEIRKAVSAGNMHLAADYLGYPFFAGGKVVKGDARGRKLGFRTANISLEPGKIYPPDGVYAALTYIEGKWRTAALNIGSNPTFEGVRIHRCEAHITNFSGELYETSMGLFIVAQIRGEKKFSGADELIKQIDEDKSLCEKFCAKYLAAHKVTLDKFAAVL